VIAPIVSVGDDPRAALIEVTSSSNADVIWLMVLEKRPRPYRYEARPF
jgi:hypothetical protein